MCCKYHLLIALVKSSDSGQLHCTLLLLLMLMLLPLLLLHAIRQLTLSNC
jgi:hypothetical protein